MADNHKMVLAVAAVGLIIALAITFIDIGDGANKTKSQNIDIFSSVETVEVDGHEYLIYNTAKGGGITHKANCKAEYHY